MTYFNTYTKVLLIRGIHNCIQEAGETDSAPDGKPTSLRPFRMLISLLDKPEIGNAILEEVLINTCRHLYRECGSLSDQPDQDSASISRTSSFANLTKYGKKPILNKKDDKLLTTELVKTANLLFNSFETYFMWDFLGRTFEGTCGNTKCHKDCNVEEKVKSHGPLTVLELCELISFLLEKVTLVSTSVIVCALWLYCHSNVTSAITTPDYCTRKNTHLS